MIGEERCADAAPGVTVVPVPSVPGLTAGALAPFIIYGVLAVAAAWRAGSTWLVVAWAPVLLGSAALVATLLRIPLRSGWRAQLELGPEAIRWRGRGRVLAEWPRARVVGLRVGRNGCCTRAWLELTDKPINFGSRPWRWIRAFDTALAEHGYHAAPILDHPRWPEAANPLMTSTRLEWRNPRAARCRLELGLLAALLVVAPLLVAARWCTDPFPPGAALVATLGALACPVLLVRLITPVYHLVADSGGFRARAGVFTVVAGWDGVYALQLLDEDANGQQFQLNLATGSPAAEPRPFPVVRERSEWCVDTEVATLSLRLEDPSLVDFVRAVHRVLRWRLEQHEP